MDTVYKGSPAARGSRETQEGRRGTEGGRRGARVRPTQTRAVIGAPLGCGRGGGEHGTLPVVRRPGAALLQVAAPTTYCDSPPSHTAAAPTAYGCSPCRMRLQPVSHAATGSVTYGCSPYSIRLQPLLHTVAARITYGCSPYSIRLQPVLHRVAAPATRVTRRPTLRQ